MPQCYAITRFTWFCHSRLQKAEAGMSRDRQKIRFPVDLAESIIIESSDRSDGRVVQTQTCVARYFRISLLADVYYLFAASNPFDIPRRRINRSADHRGGCGPVSRENANINNFLCRAGRYRSPILSEWTGRYYPAAFMLARLDISWPCITKMTLFPFQVASSVPRAIVIMPAESTM